jgi:hypothetical protein
MRNLSTYSIAEFFENIERKKMYLIDVLYQWKYVEYQNWFIETTRIRAQSTDPSLDELNRRVEVAAYELARRKSNPLHEIETKNVHIDSIVEVKNQQSLANIPVFRYVYSYPNLNLIEMTTPYISCGCKLLLSNYPKKAKFIEELESFFLKNTGSRVDSK